MKKKIVYHGNIHDTASFIAAIMHTIECKSLNYLTLLQSIKQRKLSGVNVNDGSSPFVQTSLGSVGKLRFVDELSMQRRGCAVISYDVESQGH
jgi:hypothetical protein